MRAPPTVPLAAVLGLALAGCDSGQVPRPPDRPARPVVASVVIRVPGMTQVAFTARFQSERRDLATPLCWVSCVGQSAGYGGRPCGKASSPSSCRARAYTRLLK